MNKKILISLSIIGLISAMVIGGTWAYFSGTTASTGNTFGSGLMEFRIARPGSTNHTIFNVSNLKPGQVVEGYIGVVNDSTENLDMKWKAWISGWDTGTLDSVLDVRITLHPMGYDYDDFTAAGYTIAGPDNHEVTDWTHIHNLTSGNTILAWDYACCEGCVDEPFRVKWAAIYKIEIKMQETAGNAYQNQSFTGDINFYATQCEAPLF